MGTAVHLVLAALLLAAAPQSSANWGLYKAQGPGSRFVEKYATKDECLVSAGIFEAANDGWRYYCLRR